MRCFVAVEFATELRKPVGLLQKELADLDTKLVEPENLHFTLKFLGEVDEGIVNKVKDTLKELAEQSMPFSIDISGVGVFPNEKLIRVIWIGVKDDSGANRLSNLQAAVNESLSDLFKKEKPSPHLTLARVRSQKYRKEILEFLDRHRDAEIGTMNVDKIKLKKSTVTNKGPVYEDIEVYELGKSSG